MCSPMLVQKIPQSPQDSDNNSSWHCQQTKNPLGRWATTRDILATRQMLTHWPTGELPPSLGPKSNQKSAQNQVSWNCEIQIPTYLCEGILFQALLMFLGQMASTGTHLIYFKIFMPIYITSKSYFFYFSIQIQRYGHEYLPWFVPISALYLLCSFRSSNQPLPLFCFQQFLLNHDWLEDSNAGYLLSHILTFFLLQKAFAVGGGSWGNVARVKNNN